MLTSKLGNEGMANMNRDEILEKSRAQKSDEMEVYIKYRAIKWAFVTMTILSGIFTVLRDGTGTDLIVIVCGSVSVSWLYRFIKMKDKFYLLLFFITLAVAIMALVRYCMGF